MIHDRLSPIDTSTAEHYLWGGICDGWHLLKSQDLSVIQEYVPAGASEVNHFHTNAQQFFYVLTGVATLEFDGHAHQVNAGQGIHIPAGTPHRFANCSSEGVSFLVISSPSTAGDRTNID
ncbi:MAG: cupin domain-containing protein [Burkholderiaceae bacterium]|nr:cupin domain-containing protein [Burkholderiaceae bacterium]